MHISENTKKNPFKQGTVLIFGGSGIIGRAIATEFGRQGWSVGIQYHQNLLSAEETCTAIREAGGEARPYQSNVTEPAQVKNLFHSFVQDYGSLTFLVWAVGIAPSKLLAKTTSEEWKHTVQTNLTGAFYVLQEAGPIFEKQQDGGVVFIGSFSGKKGIAGQAAYAASKAGLIGLMQTTAHEWGIWNIRVNAIFPGWHASPLSAKSIESALFHQSHILNRTPSIKQVATSVFHLAAMQDISGQIWNLDSRL